MVNLHMKEH